MTTQDILAQLRAPFPSEEVKWRVGSTTADKSKGMALAHIDARAVMDRLDDVCGPQNWQDRYPHANNKTCCELGIRIDGEWIWKSDGAGDTDFEGEKGAFSDAFKRAAVRWGIGRYLYHLKAPWVAIEQRGRSYAIKSSELETLRSLAAQASNEGRQKVDAPPTSQKKSDLRAQTESLAADIKACAADKDPEQFAGLLRGHRQTIEALKTEAPKWWFGAGPEHPAGYKDRLATCANLCGVEFDVERLEITG